ncbi:hypothetical protein [Halomonas sp. BN3-1]|uniref:lipopolysaccharide biosynthesis protein n=1 Tax=Halomonas sp. BN3-1 TaxID=2082393 RepID=UPI0013B39D9D|nr:hypothetical protein [Halomonas sp. BN3-1]
MLKYKRFLLNSANFLAGSTVSSGATFASVLILASILTLADFGEFSLVLAIVAVIEGLCCSQSWQAVVKFYPRKNSDFKECYLRIVRASLSTDVLNAFLGIVVLVVVLLNSSWFGISDPQALAAYGIVIPFRMIGTWQGVARAEEKLKYINAQLLVVGMGKLGLALYVTQKPEMDIVFILLGFAFFEIVGSLLLVILTVGIVNKNCREWLFTKISNQHEGHELADIKRFITVNHFNVTTVLSIRNVDEVIVGKIISLEAVGVYKLIKLFAAILSKLIEPMYIVIYPEINKILFEKGKGEVLFFLKKITFISFAGALFFVLVSVGFGGLVLDEFSDGSVQNAYYALQIYVAGVAINMLFFYAHPLSISLRLEKYVLKINIVTGIVYLVCLYALSTYVGVLGVALSNFLYNVASAFLRLLPSLKKLRIEGE